MWFVKSRMRFIPRIMKFTNFLKSSKGKFRWASRKATRTSKTSVRKRASFALPPDGPSIFFFLRVFDFVFAFALNLISPFGVGDSLAASRMPNVSSVSAGPAPFSRAALSFSSSAWIVAASKSEISESSSLDSTSLSMALTSPWSSSLSSEESCSTYWALVMEICGFFAWSPSPGFFARPRAFCPSSPRSRSWTRRSPSIAGSATSWEAFRALGPSKASGMVASVAPRAFRRSCISATSMS
mmetsp:Transcript_143314/g.457991  ORF Transcript_143314/g.457991 Transcript_143314/m.457991 type:complete len:241 (-) Transcript_143314:2017-2739(-)